MDKEFCIVGGAIGKVYNEPNVSVFIFTITSNILH